MLREAALRAVRADTLDNGLFRLPIDRSFHVKGFGTVVTGTVASGSITKGSQLICYPSGAVVKVRGIESLHAAVDSVRAGQRAAINITTASDTDTSRGVMLVSPELGPFVEAALKRPTYAECSFEFIRDVDLKNGRRRFKAHHLTAESNVTIRLSNRPSPTPLCTKDRTLAHKVSLAPFPTGGRLNPPQPPFFKGGCSTPSQKGAISGRLIMATPLLALRGDRLILRDTGRNETIGVAVVNALWLDKKKTASAFLFSLSPCGRGLGRGGKERHPPFFRKNGTRGIRTPAPYPSTTRRHQTCRGQPHLQYALRVII